MTPVIFLFQAEVFIPLAAEVTLVTGPVNPRDTHSVIDLQLANGRALLDHAPGNLVAKNERLLDDSGQLHPVRIGNMQIGVAHPAGFYCDEDFTFLGSRPIDFLNGEGLFEFVEDSSLHGEDSITAGRPAGKIPPRSARDRSAYGDR